MEQRMRETEQIVARIMAESDKRTMEADRLKNELLKARLAEKDAKEKLLQFLSEPAVQYPPVLSSLRPTHHHAHDPHEEINGREAHQHAHAHAHSHSQSQSQFLPLLHLQDPVHAPLRLEVPERAYDVDCLVPLSQLGGNGIDMDPLNLEIEKERVEYLEKSKSLQEQLRELKTEIEGLKLDEKQTSYDLLHQEQVLSGENKYSTLRKVGTFPLFH